MTTRSASATLPLNEKDMFKSQQEKKGPQVKQVEQDENVCTPSKLISDDNKENKTEAFTESGKY